MRAFTVATTIFLTCLTSVVTAGPGASMNACVHFPSASTLGDRMVYFTVGGGADQCMLDGSKGSNANILANKAGLTCTSVGYVESKNSAGCHFMKSIWTLSYSVNEYSGSTQTKWEIWWTKNYISLQSQSAGTHICSSAAKCGDDNIEWEGGTQGGLYIIFEPQTQGGKGLGPGLVVQH